MMGARDWMLMLWTTEGAAGAVVTRRVLGMGLSSSESEEEEEEDEEDMAAVARVGVGAAEV